MKKGLHYFSQEERVFEREWSGARDRFFDPLCSFLARVGISPNLVSLAGLAMLVGVWLNFAARPQLAFAFLVLYVLCDAIDGCVARKLKRASRAGAFVDIICDQTGMAVVTILLMAYNLISPVMGGAYIYAYCLMIAVTVTRNALGVPPRWIFRTKYFLFLVYGAWAFRLGDWFSEFFWIATPLTIVFAVSGCVMLYRRLKRVR